MMSKTWRSHIQQLLRKEVMQESVCYQAIKAEGKAEGSEEKARQIAVNFLSKGMTIDAITRITGLGVELVQQLRVQQADNQQR